ncbi:MAG: glycosyltransferase family 39 protein [Thermoleophilia bacterium]
MLVVAAQPVRSPWWTYADADAAYTATSLNLLDGERAKYLDHPGLPLEEAGALAFGVQYAADRVRGDVGSRREYVDRKLANLDSARPIFRGVAIAFYLAGAVLSFLLVGRALGTWSAGLAAGILWTAAPGLVAMSIQFRPDVPLSVLVIVFAYFVGRGIERRSAADYFAAAFVVGFAMMVKLHAAGLLVPLGLAAAWRPPKRADIAAAQRSRLWTRRWQVTAGLCALLAAIVNLERVPFRPTAGQLAATLAPLLLVAAAFAAVRLAPPRLRRVFDPSYPLIAAAVLAGLAVPIAFDLPDGLQSMVNLENGLTGHGINVDIPLFATPISTFWTTLKLPFLIFVLAGLGAVVGLITRDARPVVWFAGAVVLGVMADARLAAIHYFAPAFVLSVPAALWLFRPRRLKLAALLVWPLVLYVTWPAVRDRDTPSKEAREFRTQIAPAAAAVAARLRPGEFALTAPYAPVADTRYFQLVEQYVNYTPERPYRFLPATTAAAALAQSRGLRARYFVGPEARDLRGRQTVSLYELGSFTLQPLPGVNGAAEIVPGP